MLFLIKFRYTKNNRNTFETNDDIFIALSFPARQLIFRVKFFSNDGNFVQFCLVILRFLSHSFTEPASVSTLFAKSNALSLRNERFTFPNSSNWFAFFANFLSYHLKIHVRVSNCSL